MCECMWITVAGLAHLNGIHTLNMRGCEEITDVGHLTGVHTACVESSDADLAHLTGISALFMSSCDPDTCCDIRKEGGGEWRRGRKYTYV